MSYKYDVAISFSDTQKDIAVGIHVALEKININSYYYLDRQEENTGKDLESSLREIYGNISRLGIIIVSKDYSKSKYTKLEMNTILKRLKSDPNYLILLVRKGTKAPKPLKKLTYIEWNSDPEEVAEIVQKRLLDVGNNAPANIQIPPNIIKIDRQKHEPFLADHRVDPISRQLIRVGDEVVVCQKCKLVFLKEVWLVTLHGVHCNQSETLIEIPKSINYSEKSLENRIEKINNLISVLKFELHIGQSGLYIDEVYCTDSYLVFKIHLYHNHFIRVEICLAYVHLSSCKFTFRSENKSFAHLKSTQKNGITIKSGAQIISTQKDVGFLIEVNHLKGQPIIREFSDLLIKIIETNQKL